MSFALGYCVCFLTDHIFVAFRYPGPINDHTPACDTWGARTSEIWWRTRANMLLTVLSAYYHIKLKASLAAAGLSGGLSTTRVFKMCQKKFGINLELCW